MATVPLSPLRIIPDSVTIDRPGPPRLDLELRRSQYPADDGEVFQPLRLPDRCAITVGGPVLQGLSRVQGELELKLRELIEKYPNAPQANEARVLLGLPPVTTKPATPAATP